MYKRILVPLDGSDLAEEILPHVQALAEKFGSNVVLLYARQTPSVILAPGGLPGGVPVAVPVRNPEEFVEGEKQAIDEYLQVIADRIGKPGFTVSGEQIEGPPAEVILRRAKELNVDLIAMTTHGRGGLRLVVFGSVAEAVLHHATCPVLLVRVSEDSAR